MVKIAIRWLPLVVTLVLLGGTLAYGQSSNTINACYHTQTGAMRYVGAETTCRNSEEFISWPANADALQGQFNVLQADVSALQARVDALQARYDARTNTVFVSSASSWLTIRSRTPSWIVPAYPPTTGECTSMISPSALPRVRAEQLGGHGSRSNLRRSAGIFLSKVEATTLDSVSSITSFLIRKRAPTNVRSANGSRSPTQSKRCSAGRAFGYSG